VSTEALLLAANAALSVCGKGKQAFQFYKSL